MSFDFRNPSTGRGRRRQKQYGRANRTPPARYQFAEDEDDKPTRSRKPKQSAPRKSLPGKAQDYSDQAFDFLPQCDTLASIGLSKEAEESINQVSTPGKKGSLYSDLLEQSKRQRRQAKRIPRKSKSAPTQTDSLVTLHQSNQRELWKGPKVPQLVPIQIVRSVRDKFDSIKKWGNASIESQKSKKQKQQQQQQQHSCTRFTPPDDNDSDVEMMDTAGELNSSVNVPSPRGHDSDGRSRRTAFDVDDDDDHSKSRNDASPEYFSAIDLLSDSKKKSRPDKSLYEDEVQAHHPYEEMESSCQSNDRPTVDFYAGHYDDITSSSTRQSRNSTASSTSNKRKIGTNGTASAFGASQHPAQRSVSSKRENYDMFDNKAGAIDRGTSRAAKPKSSTTTSSTNSFALRKRNGKSKPSTKIVPGLTFSREVDADPIESCSSQSSVVDIYTGRRRKRKDSDTEEEEWTDENACNGANKKKQRAANTRRKSTGIDSKAFHQHSLLSTPATRTRGRQARKQKNTNIEINLLSDDSDEESEQAVMSSPEPPPRRGQLTMRAKKVDAVRIAIGNKVFHSDCGLSMEYDSAGRSKSLKLSYRASQPDDGVAKKPSKQKGSLVHHEISVEDTAGIEEMKYFLVGDENEANGEQVMSKLSSFDESDEMSFLAMRITPNGKNGLDAMSESYLRSPSNTRRGLAKTYIVVEFRSDKELMDVLKVLRRDGTLGAYVDEAARLEPSQVPDFAASLIDDSKKEKKRREDSLGSPRKVRTRMGKRTAADGDEIMLVYPFGVSEEAIDKAAEGLHEASGASLRNDVASAPGALVGQQCRESDELAETSDVANDSANVEDAKPKGRAHFVTIRGDDRDRLSHGEFLNDTLIDFWMQWIWRKEKANSSVESDVHFFTSHFYTTLKEEGPAAVMSWTAKKGIDVMRKKFVFIPVNKNLHWSLCVVVNPSHILRKYRSVQKSTIVDDDAAYPCILFFDSLKAHRKAEVAKAVRKWLNSEWRRLDDKYEQVESPGPFNTKTMPVIAPRVPYQDNSWDCGVFVCRYAYSMYLLRQSEFTFADASQSRPFNNAITESPEFEFGMDEIRSLRDEFGVLVDRLSKQYKTWKAKEAMKAKQEKEKRRAQKAAEEKKREEEVAGAEKIGAISGEEERGLEVCI